MPVKLVEPPLRLRELTTPRLRMRLIAPEDEAFLQRCSSDPRIALGMGMLVPYPEGKAAEWINKKMPRRLEEGEGFGYIALHVETGERVGCLGCNLALHHARATLWYWLDVPYWKQGLCTEATTALLDYVFGELGMNRVEAVHHINNPASGGVMKKLGMKPEGLLRKHSHRGGAYVDTWQYAVLYDEWPPAG